ncbi:DUF3348 domain-containing protein [Rhodoferax koreensis]|uniref:DUF3348 domain-containing protein n=1 Tax=Rhodoferax koreensis TaxID=1842727 RepID=UPI0012FFBDAA|nr:DUF3348 domain-containing protein [Rhodoferax koreense]
MRRNFNSSKLVRLLGDASAVDADTSRQDIAERLSAWVGVFDSVTLHAAHQSIRAVVSADRAEPPSARALALQEQVHRVRSVLEKAITTNEVEAGGDRRSRHAAGPVEPTPEEQADFAPQRQRYLDQQRNMDLMIGPLRANLREALAAASPRLRQLAALDAVWEQMLEPHERRLLPTMPGFLERRFQQLRNDHAQDDPAAWRRPGGWLDVFDRTLQEVLLAELDARLQPVMGLMEAWNSGASRHSNKEVEKHP